MLEMVMFVPRIEKKAITTGRRVLNVRSWKGCGLLPVKQFFELIRVASFSALSRKFVFRVRSASDQRQHQRN